jgi:hypothetical protein
MCLAVFVLPGFRLFSCPRLCVPPRGSWLFPKSLIQGLTCTGIFFLYCVRPEEILVKPGWHGRGWAGAPNAVSMYDTDYVLVRDCDLEL